VTGPPSDSVFYALAVVWFLSIALSPRKVILFLSFGQSRISDTGVIALRWLGIVFAILALVQVVLALTR
jgi:hypothetical protein